MIVGMVPVSAFIAGEHPTEDARHTPLPRHVVRRRRVKHVEYENPERRSAFMNEAEYDRAATWRYLIWTFTIA